MSAEKMNTMHRNQTGSFMFDLSFLLCPLEYKSNWPAPSQNICANRKMSNLALMTKMKKIKKKTMIQMIMNFSIIKCIN